MSYFEILQRSMEEMLRNTAYALPYWAAALLVFALALAVAGPSRALARRAVVRAKVVRQLEELFGRLAYLAVLVAGVVWALALIGVNWAALVAGLGLTALAIGLAVKPVLENLIAGMLLLFERPFGVGDFLAIGDVEGTVVDVAVRVTRLKTLDGFEVLVPNAQVYQSVVVNKTRYALRRLTLTVRLGPNDLLGAVLALRAAVQAVGGVAPEPPVEAVVTGLEGGGAVMALNYWVDAVALGSRVAEVRSSAAAAVLAAGAREGLEVAFPERLRVEQL
jgi:small conductance mechanosensitive channel